MIIARCESELEDVRQVRMKPGLSVEKGFSVSFRGVLASKIVFLISLIVFRMFLDLGYILFVNKFYSHSGFDINYNMASYTVSWVIYIFSFALVRHRVEKISDFYFVVAVVCMIAPLTSLYGLDSRSLFPVLVSVLSLAMVKAISSSRLVLMPSIPYFKGGRAFAVIASVICVIYLVGWYIVSGAASHINFSFEKIYEFRAINSELTNVGILAYLNSWVYQIFNTFLIAFFLFRRNFFVVILLFLVQIFFYGVSSHKVVLFLPFLVFGIWLYFRRATSLIALPLTFTFVIAFSYLYYVFLGDIMFPSMFIRRVFFVPAELTFDYFEFFSKNPYVLWSNSIFSGLFHYPYDDSVPKMIGEFVGSGGAANNGYVSSGYAHAGLGGVFIYSLLLGVVLKLLNLLGRSGIPLWFGLALTVVPLRSLLVSSDLLVVMLTHGLIVSIFLFILVRVKKNA